MTACAQKFIDLLEEKNFNYTVGTDSDGDTCVNFPYQGKVARCFFTGENGHYLSIYIVFENVPSDKIVDLLFICNELNCQYKWATFFIDSENDILIHDDAILDENTAADEAMELLIRLLNITDDAKPKIMKGIYA